MITLLNFIVRNKKNKNNKNSISQKSYNENIH